MLMTTPCNPAKVGSVNSRLADPERVLIVWFEKKCSQMRLRSTELCSVLLVSLIVTVKLSLREEKVTLRTKSCLRRLGVEVAQS